MSAIKRITEMSEAENVRKTGDEKYPESVYRASAMIKKAGRSPSPGKEEEEKGREPANADTSPPSSGSDTPSPAETPESPSVSCGHHSCGSLFARCAEHGRSQLLQTFTDPESLLSKQTFHDNSKSRGFFQRRSNSYHNVFRNSKIEPSLKNPRQNGCKERFSVRRQKSDGPESRNSLKAESSVVYSKYFRTKNSKTYPDTSDFRSVSVKRHVSLPHDDTSVRIDPGSLPQETAENDKDLLNKLRSSSESKIFKVGKSSAPVLDPKSCEKKFNRISFSDPLSKRFGKNDHLESLPVNYLILESSSEAEDLEEESETDREREERFPAGLPSGSMGNGAVCKLNVSVNFILKKHLNDVM